LRFSDVFCGSACANDHLRPKVWYENGRKNMENRFLRELKKFLIFDQKILAVADELTHPFDNFENFRSLPDEKK